MIEFKDYLSHIEQFGGGAGVLLCGGLVIRILYSLLRGTRMTIDPMLLPTVLVTLYVTLSVESGTLIEIPKSLLILAGIFAVYQLFRLVLTIQNSASQVPGADRAAINRINQFENLE